MDTTEGTKTMNTYTSKAALFAATLGIEVPEDAFDRDQCLAEHEDEMPPYVLDGGLWSLDPEADQ